MNPISQINKKVRKIYFWQHKAAAFFKAHGVFFFRFSCASTGRLFNPMFYMITQTIDNKSNLSFHDNKMLNWEEAEKIWAHKTEIIEWLILFDYLYHPQKIKIDLNTSLKDFFKFIWDNCDVYNRNNKQGFRRLLLTIGLKLEENKKISCCKSTKRLSKNMEHLYQFYCSIFEALFDTKIARDFYNAKSDYPFSNAKDLNENEKFKALYEKGITDEYEIQRTLFPYILGDDTNSQDV